tara:strand:+ start:95 stop:232 length:138 start_codon:yes stop_codon:yes gene_type:complete
MNGIECISITAAITTIIHFTVGCFTGCYNNKEEEIKTYHKLEKNI